jgi:hypothetical protein
VFGLCTLGHPMVRNEQKKGLGMIAPLVVGFKGVFACGAYDGG